MTAVPVIPGQLLRTECENGTSLSIVAGHNGHKAIAETNTSGRALTANVNDRVNTVASTVKGATYTASAWIRVSVSRISAAVREGEWKGSPSPGRAASGTAWLTTTAWTFVTVDYVALTTGATIDLNYLAWALPARASLYVSEPSLVAKVPGTPTQVTVTPADQTVGYGDSDPAFTYATTGLQGTDTLTAPPHVWRRRCALGRRQLSDHLLRRQRREQLDRRLRRRHAHRRPESADHRPEQPGDRVRQQRPGVHLRDTGLRGSDALITAPTCGVTGSHSAVGTYPITCAGADAGGNYTVAYGTGTLTVSAATRTMVFDDEFNGTAVDTSKWRVRNNSWASNELSIVTSRPSNVFVSNGVLTLRAQREQYTVGSTTRSYTSGYLDTIGLSGYEYGRWEMRAKLPSAQGLWPAFWLRGDHTTGEIDILEAIGGLPQMAVQTVFPNTNDGSVKKSNVFNLPAGNGISNWHVYGFTWTPGSMSWDIDGVTVFTVTSTTASWIGTGFLDTFNIRLILQVGGSMPNYFQKPVDASTPFPADYQVDYVRVYDR